MAATDIAEKREDEGAPPAASAAQPAEQPAAQAFDFGERRKKKKEKKPEDQVLRLLLRPLWTAPGSSSCGATFTATKRFRCLNAFKNSLLGTTPTWRAQNATP
ncbi:hypothetical protein ENH_00011580 [Eimeria necatrix]|uniref:Uncharacterized protein n=1 Tax=Eimeria necatrix TaxID=51315 RepID=U6MVX2_9EIME|nr:hypothetical protein ENH_00011580 [Eimeria necatrix]CDJ65875.1 hypothetical protein ENH_00011580 [Eimeria necatrix]